MRFYRNLILLMMLSMCFLGCSSVPDPKPVPDMEELRRIYLRAIDDAKIAENNEINTNLTAITKENKALIWKNSVSCDTVLVVNWTKRDDYDDFAGKPFQLEQHLWVTIVPELKEFCLKTKIQPDEKETRLKQLLGLPPNKEKTRFVEIWVATRDLYRPCPDPEISDRECELDFPQPETAIQVSDEHKTWFNHQLDTSYTENGYPWTRLGYTYDWADQTADIGISEFVIREGATIIINGVYLTDDYCISKP